MLFQRALMRILAAVLEAEGGSSLPPLCCSACPAPFLTADNAYELGSLTGIVGKGQHRLKGHSSDMYVSLGKRVSLEVI